MDWIAKAARCRFGAHVLGLQIISTYQGKRERRHHHILRCRASKARCSVRVRLSKLHAACWQISAQCRLEEKQMLALRCAELSSDATWRLGTKQVLVSKLVEVWRLDAVTEKVLAALYMQPRAAGFQLRFLRICSDAQTRRTCTFAACSAALRKESCCAYRNAYIISEQG